MTAVRKSSAHVLMLVGDTIANRRRTGIQRVVVQTARAMAGQGPFDLVRWDALEGRLRFLDAVELDQMFGVGAWPEGLELRPEARNVGRPFHEHLENPSATWLLVPEIKHETDALARAMACCRDWGGRVAAIFYDLIPITNPTYAGAAIQHETYLAELLQADLIVPISCASGLDLAQLWRERGLAPVPPIEPLLLPDGGFGDPSRAGTRGDAPSNRTIVMFGTVEPRKRQVQTIEAMAAARARSPEVARWRMVVIGGVLPAVLKAFTTQVDRHDWLTHHDYVSDEALAETLAAADFTVFASEDEGYGLPISESLAAGVPCLCADFGSMAEIAAAGGCLTVDVRDLAALEGAIARLCEDAALRERLRGEIRGRAFRSWADYAAGLRAMMTAQRVADGVDPAERERVTAVARRAIPKPPSRGRLRRICVRLVDAIGHHGLATVLKAIVSSCLRYGLVATVRLGGVEQPFPWTRKTSDQAMLARPNRPPDLDEAGALDLAQWRRWLALSAEQDRPDPDTAAVSLTVVVQGDDAEARARTRGALAALDLPVWRTGEPGPGPKGLWLFLKAGDLPEPDLPRMLARAALEGTADVLSFDLWRQAGERAQPLLLPGANPTLLRQADYLFSRMAVAADVVPPGADPESLDPRGLVLDWLEGRRAHQIRSGWRHLRRPLVCIQLSEDRIELARLQALEHGRRPPPPRQDKPISAIVCTRDTGEFVGDLVGRLLDEAPDLVGEVVIVANNARSSHALQSLDDLARRERVTVLRRDEPFNLSRLSNAGARASAGRGPLLFLHDATTPVGRDWLARLAARLDRPDIGAVGPLQRHPDERLGKPGDDDLFTACAAREVSALTGMALLTPRAVFEALGGFDEQLATSLQDVDYCLRLRAVGLVSVFEPASVLMHRKSVSIREIDAGQEFQRQRLAERTRFRERWGDPLINDPLHPHGFDLEDGSLWRRAGADGSKPRSG